MTAKTDPAKLDNAVSLYLSGKSALEVQTLVGIDRGVVKAELIRRGIEPRGRSAAGKLRASKMTAEEIAAQTAAAHAASKGRRAARAERVKRAATVEAKPPAMSVHEAKFAGFLDQLGATWRREVAVDIYNVDFTIGPVAVEILGGEWHAYKGERHPRRIKKILDSGWALVYLWSTDHFPLTITAAEYCVTFAQQASREPSLIGEYRVIRGDAHLITTGRDELDQFSLEHAARHCIDSAEHVRRAVAGRAAAKARRDQSA